MTYRTPGGFRDVLPQEAAERDVIVRAVADAMASWGYGPVETPVAEEAVTLEAGGISLEGAAFRLFDSDQRLLALRPEMTVPIARMIATRLRGEPGPFRLRYDADVFRERASLQGEARQFTQVGLELVGVGGPASDAEVIGVLVDSLNASGLDEFDVGVGTVAVLRALIDAADMPAKWSEAVLAAAHERNIVGLDALAAETGVPPAVAAALSAVPRLRGRRDAIDECRSLASGCGCGSALDDLQATWDLLERGGATERVSIDFGIMRSFDYYTGMVLEVYVPGSGLPLGGGGRYDGVMAEFGSPAPAAGFAIGLERLHASLADRATGQAPPAIDAVLGGDPAARFAAAARLREAGWAIRLSAALGLDLVREAASSRSPEALLAEDGGEIVRLDRAGEPSLPLESPIPAPPLGTWAREGS